jgi:hypothetical protein
MFWATKAAQSWFHRRQSPQTVLSVKGGQKNTTFGSKPSTTPRCQSLARALVGTTLPLESSMRGLECYGLSKPHRPGFIGGNRPRQSAHRRPTKSRDQPPTLVKNGQKRPPYEAVMYRSRSMQRIKSDRTLPHELRSAEIVSAPNISGEVIQPALLLPTALVERQVGCAGRKSRPGLRH